MSMSAMTGVVLGQTCSYVSALAFRQRPKQNARILQQRQQSQIKHRCASRPFVVAATPSGGGAAAQSPPSAADLYARDQLLDKLLQAKSQKELGSLVADNILTFDQSFWMRLALKHDEATDDDEKRKLSSLASTVAQLVEAIVKASEGQTAQSAQILQKILTAAADEKGEWRIPLSEDKEAEFEKAVQDNFASLDEALLSNALAWMRRCKEDGLTEVYVLLQRILQLYAAGSLVRESSEPSEQCINAVLKAKPDTWSEVLQQQLAANDVSEAAFTEALQKRMETVVLTMTSGSHTQRVQAEFLKEIESTAKSTFVRNA